MRASDGLFEIIADVKADDEVVEFGLKSVFYNGLGPQPGGKDDTGRGPMESMDTMAPSTIRQDSDGNSYIELY